MSDLVADTGAMRVRLDEADWCAAYAGAGSPGFDGWATPRTLSGTTAVTGPPPEERFVDLLRVRDRAPVVVTSATTSGASGVLAELATDLTSCVCVARRLAVPTTAGEPTRALEGVEVSGVPVGRLVDEVLRTLPPVPAPSPLAAADLPEELTAAFGLALRRGDARTVDAVCADRGWSAVPEVLLALVHERVGSATVTVHRHGASPVVGHWQLTRRGWVELVPVPSGVVRHVPRSREDIGRSLVAALATTTDAVLRDADRAADEGEDR